MKGMPDSAAKTQPSQPGSNTSALVLGERLRSARKARALSLEAVADALHLDESIVLALEDEQFDTLGAAVFVRGHLKAYARLVGLSTDSVLDAYRATDPLSDIPPRMSEFSNRSVAINPVTSGFWSLVVLLALGLTFYVLQDDMESPVLVSRTTVEPPLSESSPIGQIAAPVTESAVVEPAGVVEPTAVDEPLVETAPERTETGLSSRKETNENGTAPVPIDAGTRLGLFFNQESWVEISDANRRILFGLQREGIRRDLTGEMPFRLLIGNASGVQVYLNDVLYPVPPAGVTGNVARFEISEVVGE